MKLNETQVMDYISLKCGFSNPDPFKLAECIQKAILYNQSNEEIGVVVEDEEGEIRNIGYVWFDQERQMLRLTIQKTKFEDYEEPTKAE